MKRNCSDKNPNKSKFIFKQLEMKVKFLFKTKDEKNKHICIDRCQVAI